VPRSLDEVGAEEGVDVDWSEREIVGDGGRVEEEGAQREQGDRQDPDR
jgi:hypothetical protein